MTEAPLFKIRLYFTGIITIAIWLLLAWNHYHGGVPSHHILARKDLPSISNWWGALLLPVLSWFLLYRIQQRLIRNKDKNPEASKFPTSILYQFLGALLVGISLATFFTLGYPNISGYLLQGVFLIALFFPIYRAECLLGFVLGMTYTFGAVLPTGIGSILTLIAAVLYLYVRPAILYVFVALMRIVLPKRDKIN